jgi:arylsulfatase A-like enzyme
VRRRWALGVLLAGLAGCAAPVPAPAGRADRRPNLVFVLVDDLGYGDLGCYGGRDIPTPQIDRLASEGIRFTDFYANAPVCTPTRAAFMTGRWQQRLGIEWALGYTAEQQRRVNGAWVDEPDIHKLGLPLGEVTLASILKKAGYATGAFGKWHLGYPPEYNPVRRGFDEYFGTLLGHADYFRHAYYDGTYALRDGDRAVRAEGYLTDLVNRRAVEFVRKHAGEPFFLYVPHQAVHAPYQPPGPPAPPVTKENMNDGDRRAYAAMLGKVDEGVGHLLSELARLGLDRDTLFVLSSDNGGAHHSDNSPLFHGKQSLWEGGIRVPCLMRWPGRLPAGRVARQPALTMDVTATFAALAGAAPPPGRPFDGIDLLAPGAPEVPRAFFWRIDRSTRKQKAVRHGRWKLVLDGGYTSLLFDLEADPGERRNLAIRHPEVLRDLERRLRAWEAEVDAHEKEIRIR